MIFFISQSASTPPDPIKLLSSYADDLDFFLSNMKNGKYYWIYCNNKCACNAKVTLEETVLISLSNNKPIHEWTTIVKNIGVEWHD